MLNFSNPPAGGADERRGNDGQVRIIGGRWRNTRLPVPTLPGCGPAATACAKPCSTG
jgi:16S rRNA (guanine966-N2)-methyltransferase